MMNDALRNMRFMMECLRNIPANESIALGNSGGFCVSTCTKFENWVYFPDPVNDIETVKAATEFFSKRNESFTWPVFDGGNEILSDAGLFYGGKLRAMTLDSDSVISIRGNDSVTFSAVTSREDSLRWAECAWHGFEYGKGKPDDDYCAFAENLMSCKNFALYIAVLHGRDCGAFLVSDGDNLSGVYSFAVIPEMRRKGIAVSMMNEIRRLSHGKKIVLQAETKGIPFYSAYGFKDAGGIDIFSNSED